MLLLPAYTQSTLAAFKRGNLGAITQPIAPALTERVIPQPPKPTKTIFTDTGIVTSAEVVYRRRMIDLGRDVFLMDGRNQQLVSLKPAQGELFRQPTKFIAVVLNVQGQKKDLVVKAWQPLSVH